MYWFHVGCGERVTSSNLWVLVIVIGSELPVALCRQKREGIVICISGCKVQSMT